MSELKRDVKIFVLKTLLAADGQPISSETLVASITTRFSHVAMTFGDMREIIKDAERQKLIAGTNDELLGVMWALTTKGKIAAQELP